MSKGSTRKSSPASSPEGTLIAYAPFDDATNLLLKTLDDQPPEQVGRVGEKVRGVRLALSPDGRRLVHPSLSRGHHWFVDLRTGLVGMRCMGRFETKEATPCAKRFYRWGRRWQPCA